MVAVMVLVLLGGAAPGIVSALKVVPAGLEPLRAQATTPSRPSGAAKEKEAKKTRATAAEAEPFISALGSR